MRIAIGSDHRGFQIKSKLVTVLAAMAMMSKTAEPRMINLSIIRILRAR